MSQEADIPDLSAQKNGLFYERNLNEWFHNEDRSFFEAYTGLTGKALEDHLNVTRDKAFELGEYPCIGMWDYLRNRWPQIITSNGLMYSDFTSRLANGACVLDVGCCFGQALRRLATDSATSAQNWYATDLRRELWDIGHELFRDTDSFAATFVQADLLSDGGALWKLDKKFDVMLASKVLHLFSWDQNIAILQRLVKLMDVGCQVVGEQASSVLSNEQKTPWGTMFFHDLESWKRMWSEVGRLAGTEWDVKAMQMPYTEFGATPGCVKASGPNLCALLFVVTRSK